MCAEEDCPEYDGYPDDDCPEDYECDVYPEHDFPPEGEGNECSRCGAEAYDD